MNGKIIGGFLVLSGVIAGAAMYYLQVYAFYDDVSDTTATVELTTVAGGAPETILADNIDAIDADSSPLRFRACFETPMNQAMLTETYALYDGAVPLNAPGWFDCFDADAIGAILDENGIERMDRLILRRLVRGIRPLIFAVHSFTPDYGGRPRRFDSGVLYERHRGLAHRLGRNLRRAGLSVRYNQPYSGMAGMMYAVDRHGSHHRLPCLELEIRQDLLLERSNVARIGAAVTAGIAEILGIEEAKR